MTQLTGAESQWSNVQAWLALIAVLGAGGLSAWLTGALAQGRWRGLQVLDQPNARSLHRQPVPRTGGLAVLAGFMGAFLLLLLMPGPRVEQAWLGAALVLVAAISFLDDRRTVPPAVRFAVHLTAAALLWLGGLRWHLLGLPEATVTLPIGLGFVLTLLYITWMLNLYNFMDGMDGLAAGMAAIGFSALAVLGLQGGELRYAAVCAATAAAAIGFLTQNWPPARIFLGDVGSSSLGLIAGGLTLWGASVGLFPLWVGWLIFSPFIVDATWTLIRRALNGERVWQAHRSHHYQRLVLAGWGHRRTLLRALLLMLAAAASGVAAVNLSPAAQWQLIAAWGIVYMLIHLRVGMAERAARG